jgi:hypothetical protein
MAGRINRDNLHELFKYHEPTPAKLEQYQSLRRAAYDFANAILAQTPECADQQAALRLVREALMTANAAIALDGMV